MIIEQENNFKKVGQYSPAELEQFQKIFAADLKQYRATDRRYANPLLVVFLLGVAAVVCSYLLSSQPPIQWLLGVGIVLIAGVLVSVAVAASSLEKQLKCPVCHSLFIDDIEKYCPECGSASLGRGGAFGAIHCNSCGKKLISGKNRNFRYKACTHCGVFLEQKGL
jgi:RNA polymerase subunit RPABC4/transcription elongation factor Spt4